jgi:hypothetical protein
LLRLAGVDAQRKDPAGFVSLISRLAQRHRGIGAKS